MEEQPWFQKGLRFECTQCGDCCTGAPGYVWVNREEIEALAKDLEMAVDEFERRFVRRVGIRKSLVEYANGDCVFFDNRARKCTVYDARPATVPHLALLAIERRDAGSLEADLRSVPRQREGETPFGGENPASDCRGQAVGLHRVSHDLALMVHDPTTDGSLHIAPICRLPLAKSLASPASGRGRFPNGAGSRNGVLSRVGIGSMACVRLHPDR